MPPSDETSLRIGDVQNNSEDMEREHVLIHLRNAATVARNRAAEIATKGNPDDAKKYKGRAEYVGQLANEIEKGKHLPKGRQRHELRLRREAAPPDPAELVELRRVAKHAHEAWVADPDSAATREIMSKLTHIASYGPAIEPCSAEAIPDELEPLATRIAKGRAKYANGCTVLSLLDEAGEVAHAVNKYEPAERIRDELLDVAAVAMRLYFGEIDTGLQTVGLIQQRTTARLCPHGVDLSVWKACLICPPAGRRLSDDDAQAIGRAALSVSEAAK